jgi:hypothetical protein
MGIITSIFIAVAMAAAFPWVREAHHKSVFLLRTKLPGSADQRISVFERHHRFYGWSGLLFTWIFTILSNIYDTNGNVNGRLLVESQPFWFAMGMTIL